MGSVGKQSTGSGKYNSVEELEKDLENKGYNSEEYKQFESAYSEANNYTSGLIRNMDRSISEDGYSQATEDILNSELKMTEDELKTLGKSKTPAELGRETALKERIDEINKLKKRKGEKASGNNDINILV